jgi:hypothetical protein
MRLTLIAAAALAAGLGHAAPARAAYMWTGWEDVQQPQEQCLQTAAGRMRELGFTATVNPQTTFGWRGQDGISVRCIAERRLAVIFIYVNSSQEEGGQLLQQMRSAYTALAAPRPPQGTNPPPQPPRPGGGGKS